MRTYRNLGRDLGQIQVFRDVTPSRVVLQTFRKNVAISSSVQKYSLDCLSQKCATALRNVVKYQLILRNISEDLNLQQHYVTFSTLVDKFRRFTLLISSGQNPENGDRSSRTLLIVVLQGVI